MKKFLILILVLPSIGKTYTNLKVACRVNSGIATKISCNDSWTKMPSYPYISIRLQSCLKSRRLQVIEIKIKNTIYKPNVPQDFEVDSIIENHRIECTEYDNR